MSPETAISRVQCFLKWNAYRIDALDEKHAPIESPACYAKGKGDRLEYWILAATWRDEIFNEDVEDAEAASKALHDSGLLREQSGSPSLQCNVRLEGTCKRAYCVSRKILDWVPGSESYRYGKPRDYVLVPPPPPCPANFSALTPEEKQNCLLSSAMYLQARLPNSGIALDPQDTKAIAQLASVAQGIVRTSVELEQLRADRNKKDRQREEKIRVLINKIPDRSDEEREAGQGQ